MTDIVKISQELVEIGNTLKDSNLFISQEVLEVANKLQTDYLRVSAVFLEVAYTVYTPSRFKHWVKVI